ncbi:MAG: hypothetical protein ACP5RD_06170 [bacterium]
MNPKKNNKLFYTLFILFFFTLILYLLFKLYNQKFYNQINLDNNKKKIEYSVYYNYNYDYYLIKNLQSLKDYFYQSFIENNLNNLKVIYCKVDNYSILTKLKNVKENIYIYIEIFPIIRFKKTEDLIIKEEAQNYSKLLYDTLYLLDKKLDKNLKKELNLNSSIKIIVFDSNKIAIEKK